MLKSYKEITLRIFAFIAAFSVLMLNYAGFVNCSNMSTGEDCCQITEKVKPCCVKPVNVNSKERLKSHCGCSMKEPQPAADLYNDLNSSNSTTTLRTIVYASHIETPVDPLAVNGLVHVYSPPIRDVSSTYLTNHSIRI